LIPSVADLPPPSGALGSAGPVDAAANAAVAAAPSLSPNQRAWARFRRNRVGTWSLWCFIVLLVVSTAAELISNDRPLLAKYDGQLYAPLFRNQPGDPLRRRLRDADRLGRSVHPRAVREARQLGLLHAESALGEVGQLLREEPEPGRAEPAELARHRQQRPRHGRALLYGFRVSIWFALALTFVGTVLGVAAGALQGYFGGRVDLFSQRLMEIWGAIPELYLLIIFASIFEPSLLLLLILLSAWGWLGLSDYVRAEFLRNRSLEFVKAARALGLSNAQIIWRHVLPNSMTPVITFLPFRMSGAIIALTSLDFLGLGVPASTPSLGDLLRQGKNNLDSWWIIFRPSCCWSSRCCC
jgi:microcin C transport system permease protein